MITRRRLTKPPRKFPKKGHNLTTQQYIRQYYRMNGLIFRGEPL